MDRFPYFHDIYQLFDIYTTRFNSETFMENYIVKKKIWNHSSIGSLYSTTNTMPVSASKDKYFFILDMNNQLNRIMGIGFIKNCLAKNQEIRVYKNPCFNNYIYRATGSTQSDGTRNSNIFYPTKCVTYTSTLNPN